MEDMTKVVLDAMGGDNAPGEIVKGAVDALGREASLHIVLVGRKEDIDRELAKYSYDKNRIEVVHAEEVIETAEPPVNAIRKEERFFHRSRYEDGERRAGGRFCIGRQFRCHFGRRSGDRRKN